MSASPPPLHAAGPPLADRGVESPPGCSPMSPAPLATTGEPPPVEDTEPIEPPAEPLRLPEFVLLMPAWLVSMLTHMAVLIGLALVLVPEDDDRTARLTAVPIVSEPPPPAEEPEPLEPPPPPINVEAPMLDEPPSEPEAEIVEQDPLDTPFEDSTSATEQVEELDPPVPSALLGVVNETTKGSLKGELQGRDHRRRTQLALKTGGTHQSEAAVDAALRWLANHQHSDGGWSFDHNHGTKCQNRCSHPGRSKSARVGATAMGLLPMLGAGHTHLKGKYSRNVYRGLHFLMRNQDEKTGGLYEGGGRMYSHGLAAITLCEAYAMTRDVSLRRPAQMSLRFIVDAQDPTGGGWRYTPRQPGDTSVVGWQLMALKSGVLAYLEVPAETARKASRFLDHVQGDDYGGRYGYTGRGQGQATSAIGILCRMYLGWKQNHPGIAEGVGFLDRTGPSKNNMYYNYYATQVMRHYDGAPWKRWNKRMRDQLVNSQVKKGHAAGSWHMGDPHVGPGGRLYCTSLATMILEVYYRHLPIYRKESTEEDFPLD